MKKADRLLKKLFCLPPVPTVLIALPSFVFVSVVLATDTHEVLSYAAYVLSAYALIITVTGLAGILEAAKNGFEQNALLKKIERSPLGRRLVGDAVFRSEVTLHGGLFVNLLYVGINLFYGVRERSLWFGTLAVYYALLSAMRGMLGRYMRRRALGEDLPAEYRRFRICGILLVLMNLSLVGVVRYISVYNRGAVYSGLLIYVVATYTFYITVTAVINLLRYRRRGSPVLSAAKAISLTAALVSMLSLENAMITQFGGDTDATFRQVMTSAFGGCICVGVLIMAVVMILRANRKLREFNDSQTDL